ncbi:MAG: dTMP kinase [Elusimicrobia bacterium]|nr:dTMP kinase [Elusimicrobiota bacterium]
MRRGFFLVLEGLDKCGKSTQILRLCKRWQSLKLPVTVTREPGGTDMGERIRQLLLDRRQDVCPLAELLLYEASRAQHVAEVIAPALNKGQIVLCDRFSLSTMAYQGRGRELSMGMIRQLDDWATGGLRPDLTLVLDVSLPVTLARLGGRRDRMEQKTPLLARVKEAYARLSKVLPRVKLIPADCAIDELEGRILSTIRRQGTWVFPIL